MNLLSLKRSSSALEEAKSDDLKKEVDEEFWKSSRSIVRTLNEGYIGASSENQRHPTAVGMEDQLEFAKAEMDEVREENERLKTMLLRIVKDYQALQMLFFDTVQQEENSKKRTATTGTISSSEHDIEEAELVSLSLGNSSTSVHKTQENVKNKNNDDIDDPHLKEGSKLGHACKSQENGQSPQNSSEEPKGEDIAEDYPANKLLNTVSSAEEVSQPPCVKKARVSVRARCDTATMQDGCQWRKYGQKISKGNPCPRAYYRCTVSPSCPVRKQVQRCAEDMSILITTYEGTHNHPLPIQATAMASTTSAAAYMLMSGPSASTSGSSISAGLAFDLSDNSRSRPFYLASPANSLSLSYPTITLDLTSASSVNEFTRTSTSAFPVAPRHSSSIGFPQLSFSSGQIPSPLSWNTSTTCINTGHFNNYGPHQVNRSPTVSSLQARPPHVHQQFCQTYLQSPSHSSSASLPSPQQNLSETIAAATKAITSDPSFRSALAVAITSIVNENSDRVLGQSMQENLSQMCK